MGIVFDIRWIQGSGMGIFVDTVNPQLERIYP
jgi:hypothetical protein